MYNDPVEIAGDRLDGAREIAVFLYGSDDPQVVKKVYLDAAARRLPIGRCGGKFFASKRKLLAAYDELTNPPAKAAPPEPEPAPPARRVAAAPRTTAPPPGGKVIPLSDDSFEASFRCSAVACMG